MAKNISSVVKLQGTLKDTVFVHSKVYGDHVRTLRGSKKEAVVNEVLQGNALRTAAINAAAKQVHDLLKVYGGNFKEGQLWPELLSRMRRSKTNEFVDLLKQTEGLELNRAYVLERLISPATVEVVADEQGLSVKVGGSAVPNFKKEIDCYYYEVCVFSFTDAKAEEAYGIAKSRWIYLKDSPEEEVFSFEKPAGSVYYAVCLKLQAGTGCVEREAFDAMGIRVVGVGEW